MSERPPPEERPRRDARSYRQHQVVLLATGLAIYLLVLWFGVTIVGDTIPRSSLMAGLIVILSGMAYLTSRRPSRPPDK